MSKEIIINDPQRGVTTNLKWIRLYHGNRGYITRKEHTNCSCAPPPPQGGCGVDLFVLLVLVFDADADLV